MRALSSRLWLPIALLSLAGCQTLPPGEDTGRYAVTAAKAPFYKYGPAQAFGADFALAHGQKITMVQRGFGFSRVTTDDGITGFVSSDDIAPSADAPPPAPAAPKATARGSAGPATPRRKSMNRPEPDSGLNVNDVPLPGEPEKAKTPAVQPPKADPQTAKQPHS